MYKTFEQFKEAIKQCQIRGAEAGAFSADHPLYSIDSLLHPEKNFNSLNPLHWIGWCRGQFSKPKWLTQENVDNIFSSCIKGEIPTGGRKDWMMVKLIELTTGLYRIKNPGDYSNQSASCLEQHFFNVMRSMSSDNDSTRNIAEILVNVRNRAEDDSVTITLPNNIKAKVSPIEAAILSLNPEAVKMVIEHEAARMAEDYNVMYFDSNANKFRNLIRKDIYDLLSDTYPHPTPTQRNNILEIVNILEDPSKLINNQNAARFCGPIKREKPDNALQLDASTKHQDAILTRRVKAPKMQSK
jgi:hypothetical protein